jgi:hypothetical protein
MNRILLASAVVLSMAACRPKSPDAATPAEAAPTIEEHYAGTLPCPDCKGIDAELVLYRDPRTKAPDGYEFSETYQGADQEADGDDALGTEGDWEAQKGRPGDPNASVIALMPEDGSKTRYFLQVSERELRELDDKRADLAPAQTASLFRK